ncbi:MAG: hypothetical protein PUH15_04805, partial [Dialister sp.]|nr:hypothetical protein [Dialister sp.]MDY5545215.1 hypothetical protein [Dialister sp.]
VFVIISMRKALSLFYFCTEIITFPLKGRLSSFIVSGKFPYRVKFYTKAIVNQERSAEAIQRRRFAKGLPAADLLPPP